MASLVLRRLHAFGPALSWPTLAPLIAGRVEDELITAHWDDVARAWPRRSRTGVAVVPRGVV